MCDGFYPDMGRLTVDVHCMLLFQLKSQIVDQNRNFHMIEILIFTFVPEVSRIPSPEAPEVPYLGAEEVLDEVLVLLAKLEADRQETIEATKREKARVTMLQQQIDALNMQRLKDLPEFVQRGITLRFLFL